MAIAYQTSATAVKSSTSGTGFDANIALNSTAGDFIIVAVAIGATGQSVSSVTDDGSNTYHRVSSEPGGSGSSAMTTELWKTDKVNPAASGNIVVTLSASGSNAAAVAASYRGVAFAGRTPGVATASSGTITSSSTGLSRNSNFLLMAGGLKVSSATFTTQNGSIRNQTGTTNISACIIDNTGAANVTDSATNSSGRWAMVKVQVDELASTSTETLTMADASASNLFDYLGLADNLANWDDGTPVESLDYQFTAASDANNWLDASDETVLGAADILLAVSDQDTTWLDELATNLVETQVNQAVSDALSMGDLAVAGYGNLHSDSLNSWADSESANLSDLLAVSDQDTAWLDNWQALSQLQASLSDQLALSDAAPSEALDYVAQLADPSLSNWLDTASLGTPDYSLNVSDQDTAWADRTNLGYGLQISDQDTSWAESYAPLMATSLGLSDQDSTWLDAANLGYGLQLQDQIVTVVTDNFNRAALGSNWNVLSGVWLIYNNDELEGQSNGLLRWSPGEFLTDQFAELVISNLTTTAYIGPVVRMADAVQGGYYFIVDGAHAEIGYFTSGARTALIANTPLSVQVGDVIRVEVQGNVITGKLNGVVVLGPVTDATYPNGGGPGVCTNLDNALVYGTRATSFSGGVIGLSDALQFLGPFIGTSLSDGLAMADLLSGNNLSYESQLTDNLANWLDTVNPVTGQPFSNLTLTDNLANWLDTLSKGFVLSKQLSDALSLSDGTPSEQFNYSAQFGDSSLNNWLDLSSPALLSFGMIGDGLNMADRLSLGYGLQFNDSISLSEALGIGYGGQFSDAISWLDAANPTLDYPLTSLNLSDQLSLSDGTPNESFGYDYTLTDDSLANWLDAYGEQVGPVTILGYSLQISEQDISWDDQAIVSEAIAVISSDDLNNWLDALAAETPAEIDIKLSDQTSAWLDSNLLGYGLIASEQVANWNDLFVYTGIPIVGLAYNLGVFDSINNWADFVPAFITELGAGIGESINNWSDPLYIRYGLLISDQDTSWADTVILPTIFISRSFSDQLAQQDAWQVGYGNVIGESLANWADNFSTFGQTFLNLTDLLGDGTTWLDSLKFISGGITEVLADQLAQSDALLAGYGNSISEQIPLGETWTVGYGHLFADTANNWNEVVFPALGINKSVSDQDTTWLDGRNLGYGLAFGDANDYWIGTVSINYGGGFLISISDQLALQDFEWLGYGLGIADQDVSWNDAQLIAQPELVAVSDNLNNWLDASTRVPGATWTTSDTLSESDKLGIGYGLQSSDSLAISDLLQFGRQLGLSDSLSESDFLQLGYGNTALQDSLNNWLDAVVGFSILGEAITAADSITFSDLLGTTYGLLPAETLAFNDQMGLGYGTLFVDSDTTWQDALNTGHSLFFGDDLNQWIDHYESGVVLAFAFGEQLALQEQWLAGYGLLPSDALAASENLAIQYGLLFDETQSMDDLLAVLNLAPLDILLSDDASAFWMENLASLTARWIGPLAIYRIRSSPSLVLHRLRVRSLETQ